VVKDLLRRGVEQGLDSLLPWPLVIDGGAALCSVI